MFGADTWSNGGDERLGRNAAVFHNGTGSDIAFGSATLGVGQLAVRPPQDIESPSPISVVRWVSPASALYWFDLTATRIDPTAGGGSLLAGMAYTRLRPCTTICTVYTALGNRGLTADGDSERLLTSYFVPAGDAIEFQVQRGDALVPLGSAVVLDATISLTQPVPEPSTALLFAAGVGGLLAWRRQRQQALQRS